MGSLGVSWGQEVGLEPCKSELAVKKKKLTWFPSETRPCVKDKPDVCRVSLSVSPVTHPAAYQLLEPLSSWTQVSCCG